MTRRKDEDPVRTKDEGPIADWRETHPSYGQMLISRRAGERTDLFGSGILHQNTIAFTIKRAEKVWDEYSEWVFGKQELIEVEMSGVQFSELLTNMNVGDGIPCTLRYVMGEQMPSCPSVNVKTKINDDLNNKITELAERIQLLKFESDSIIRGDKFLKADRERLSGLLNNLMQELTKNMPFLHKCMQEAVDKTVLQGKGEIESHYTNIIAKLGFESLQKKLSEGQLTMPEVPELPDGEDKLIE